MSAEALTSHIESGAWKVQNGTFGEPYFEKIDGDGPETIRYSCWNWGCETCGPRKARSLRRAIQYSAQDGGMLYMYTLTYPGGERRRRVTPAQARTEMSEWFHALLMRLKKRKAGRLTNYVGVFEYHKRDGIPHIHFICDLYLTWREIGEYWMGLGGGFATSHRNRKTYEALKEAMKEDAIPALINDEVHQATLDPAAEKIVKRAAFRAGAYVGKYISKAIGGVAPWEAVKCYDDGSHRKKPWHRWMANRFMALQVRLHMGIKPKVCAACEQPRVKPNPECLGHPHTNYRLVERKPDGQVVSPFETRRVRRPIKGCLGHPYGSSKDCHETVRDFCERIERNNPYPHEGHATYYPTYEERAYWNREALAKHWGLCFGVPEAPPPLKCGAAAHARFNSLRPVGREPTEFDRVRAVAVVYAEINFAPSYDNWAGERSP